MNHILNFTKWSLNEDVSAGEVYNKVKAVLGSHWGELHAVPNFETFRRPGEPKQHSILYGTSHGNSFALNYAGDELYSADFWYPDSTSPAMTIYAEGGTLEELLGKIKEVGDKKQVQESLEITEVKTAEPVKKIPVVGREVKEIEAEYDYADRRTIFEDLKKYVNLVIKGDQPSLLVTGSPGVGKTFTVIEELKKAGLKKDVDYIHAKGKATSAGMYQTLYEFNGKIIVFDDMDSIFADDNSVNILKGALESEDEREISWITGRPAKNAKGEEIPQRFDFTGKVIFISNVAQKKLPAALKSRSFVLEVALSPQDMVKYIEERLADIMPTERLSLKKAALSTIQGVAEENPNVKVNIRTLIKSLKIAKGVSDPVVVKRMIIQQCSYK